MPNSSLTLSFWNFLLGILFPMTGLIVQAHFYNSSPLDEHFESICIFIIALIACCCAFEYHERLHRTDLHNAVPLKLCAKIIFTSASLAYAALLSLLFNRSLQSLVYIGWLIMLFIYFNHKKIAKTGETMVRGLWRSTQNRAFSLYELWRRRTQSGHAQEISSLPV